MPLDPQIKILLNRLKQLELPALPTLEPQEAREMITKMTCMPFRRKETVARVEDSTIPGSIEQIPIRIYTPGGSSPFPVLVYFHGGGWLWGDLNSADAICRSLANQASCLVVSVDYHLAPEYKFPVAAEDAYAATQWVVNHANMINGNPQRVAVGGDSAGGNLAAVVALMARERGNPPLVHQLLIYPVTAYAFNTPSYQECAEGYGLTKDEMLWYWNHYLPNEADGSNPYASPLLSKNLSNLPAAQIITAEFDVLRDEGEAYAERLLAAGVKVRKKRYAGMIHGFVGMPQSPNLGSQALAEIAANLRLAFE
ncbi:alpha/beta hydrolase fold domain-containing protein [Lyngbya aestuarii]|uniref:alpha/beta hydrolase fold domain-containing protein n=1 Tax=Lyngbya aestuarii TaxID=118322 RepID=UPI00403DF544